jgi:hypothetical protein
MNGRKLPERTGVLILSLGHRSDGMATTDSAFDGLTEYCEACDSDTLHQVSVQILAESRKPENVEFSREPYRVAECQRCGERDSQRMNNA